MKPCRSTASENAWRTRTSPSGPLALETMNASDDIEEPRYTCRFGSAFSSSSVEMFSG